MRTSHNNNVVLLCAGLLAAAGGVLVTWMVVPQFTEVLVSFGAELPWLTRWFVDSDGTLWGLPVSVPLLSLLVDGREDNRRGLLALSLGLAVGVLLPALCVLAMYLPIFRLGAVVG